MYITCKGLTYAKVSGGGDGSAVTYTGGKTLENLVAKVDLNFQYAEGQDHADGVRIAHKKKMTGTTVAFELADLPSDVKKDWLNWQTQTNDLLIDESDPNWIGVGFYIWNETPVSEADNWTCYWIYKSRFSVDGISVSTANDSITYQHQSVNGSGVGVKLASGGKMTFVKTNDAPLATEAAAIAWLKSEAGITGP